jgi:23S rRNA (adenine2503-C2)-methyltransferase
MLKLTKTVADPNGIVFKLIFEDEKAIAEAVVYRYGCRGVICFSVQSGCRVGCSFCGTGKKFIRNLTHYEMFIQVKEGLKLLDGYDKIQLMSMSMGEPMDNMEEVEFFIQALYTNSQIPKHDFFMSTVGLSDSMSILSLVNLFKYEHFGLQFSLHHHSNEKRKKILGGYDKLLDIKDIVKLADLFKLITGKRAYFNYLCTGKDTEETALRVATIVKGHHLTCSVLCDTKKLAHGNTGHAENFMRHINKLNYDIELSMFNPAGQDTIGGGCGQLLYVQKKLNKA